MRVATAIKYPGALLVGLTMLGLAACSGHKARDATASVSQAIALPGGTLDPTLISKYQEPLVIPPAMPQAPKPRQIRQDVDYYEIAVRQFQQHILPSNAMICGQSGAEACPPTTVWSYGSVHHAGTVGEGGTFNYPALTIEATYDRPVRVKWINELVNDPDDCFYTAGRPASRSSCDYLPHLLPIDQTLHWANPPGGVAGRDMRPTWNDTPGPYAGPVPMVTHVHGAHVADDSDGYPEAWYLPAARNIPPGYARTGTLYNHFRAKAQARTGQNWGPGEAVFQYENDQRATTLWYHDHTLGMTRTNVYAGPAGFYLLRGGPDDLSAGTLPGPAPAVGADPFGTYYEIPIVIQDRSFNDDGSLFYPDTRAFFDGIEGPYIPETDISPMWNPEFFGNTIVVNGRTWPYLEVEPRRYRFRFLNGSQSRFLILATAAAGSLPVGEQLPPAAVQFWQIGTEGGFIPEPLPLDQLLLGPAERADVIVDFSEVPVESSIILRNYGPDEPFGGGVPGIDFPLADPGTTGQVMEFRVVAGTGSDPSTLPEQLALPEIVPLPTATTTRRVSLNEEMSMFEDGPAAALLGTVSESGGEFTPTPLAWMDPTTENPTLGATEIWEIYNFTEDAHPIHLHQVMFEVVDRQELEVDEEAHTAVLEEARRPPELWEAGSFKDTVIAYPGEVTRIKARFDIPGLFVWHCHILEHEDNEMMRPYCVGDPMAGACRVHNSVAPMTPIPMQ